MFELSSSSGEAPFTPEITNLSENADTFLWDFGDSSATTNASVPNHTYTTAGTFALTLTAEGGGQSSTFTQTATVEAGPLADVKLQPAQPAVPAPATPTFSPHWLSQLAHPLSTSSMS